MSTWADRRAPAAAASDGTPLSVSAYASRIVGALRHVGGGLVEGEVQEPNVSPGGVLYFRLTDGQASISCKVFRRDRDRLDHVPRQGELVKATVDRPDLYPKTGSLNLVVSQIRLAGEGELLRRRDELVRRLTAEGLTHPARRTALPEFPRAVGIISGKDSKALTDVIQALQDRFPPVHIVVCTTLVQGAAAPGSVIDALARMQQHPLVDAIVVARGGGSVQDLMAFDDERLCRAIFACAKPVVTAIGHTDNEPVCNHIAWNAHTPSRSAEMVVPSARELQAGIRHACARVDDIPRRLARHADGLATLGSGLGAARRLDQLAADIAAASERGARAAQTKLGVRIGDVGLLRAALASIPHRLPSADRTRGAGALIDQRAREFFLRHRTEVARALDAISNGTRRQAGKHEHDYGRAIARLVRAARDGVGRALHQERKELDRAHQPLSQHARRHLSDARRSLRHAATVVDARDFRRRGWLLAEDHDGNAIVSTAQVAVGQRLHLHFRDGHVEADAHDVQPIKEET